MSTSTPGSPIIPAASILLFRSRASSELLVVRRSPSLRFFGGFLAFPGGKTSPVDADISVQSVRPVAANLKLVPPLSTRIVAAARELFEETDYHCGELWKLAQYQPDCDGDWPGCELHIFWTWYDGVQTVTCREGQALQFVKREEACYYPIPRGLVAAWDLAIAAGAMEKR